jgi:hypothetical protein
MRTEQQPETYFEKLPRELKLETLKFLFEGLTTIDEAIEHVKKYLQAQNNFVATDEFVQEIGFLIVNKFSAMGQRYSGREILEKLFAENIPALEKVKSKYNLIKAAYKGDFAKVKEHLAKNENVNAQSILFFGMSPLIAAAAFGHDNIIKELIKAGANVNLKDLEGKTALHQAISRFPSTVKLLLNAKADPNAQNLLGNTPLFETIDPEIIKILLAAGADINHQNNDGTTPLIRAAYSGNEKWIKLLLDFGSDRTIKNKDDETALDIVQKYKNRSTMPDKSSYDRAIDLLKNYYPKKRKEVS